MPILWSLKHLIGSQKEKRENHTYWLHCIFQYFVHAPQCIFVILPPLGNTTTFDPNVTISYGSSWWRPSRVSSSFWKKVFPKPVVWKKGFRKRRELLSKVAVSLFFLKLDIWKKIRNHFKIGKERKSEIFSICCCYRDGAFKFYCFSRFFLLFFWGVFYSTLCPACSPFHQK